MTHPGRPPARLRAATLLPFALLALAPGRARAYDPSLHWHTLESPHFVLTYHDGLAGLAQRTARAAESAHASLLPLLDHAPTRKVQVLLTDDVDSANGSASSYVRSQMTLLADVPDDRSELNDYEDPLWNLVTHEYTHILHLEQAYGVPAVINAIFGRMWLPNGIQPSWFIEGLAVFSESQLSGGGRNRSAVYDMYLRSEVLDGRFFRLDEISGVPSRWPRGTVAYLHGSRFLDWVATRYGTGALTRLIHNYASQTIPLAINATAQEELGTTWLELYDQWRRELTAQVEAQVAMVREVGVREGRRVTFGGEWTGEPHFLPGGSRLVYVDGSGDRRSALRSVGSDGTDDRLLRELYGTGTFALARDGRTALVTQRLPHREFYSYDDLHRLDLATGRLTQVTHGERVTDPDFSPDGQRFVAVKRLGAGRTLLASWPVTGGPAQPLYTAPEAGAVFTPRFSPDGRRVAFSEQRPEGRDIRLLDLTTGEVTDVTRDRAIDLNPTFDASGRWLLFASDRTGIYNLYARDLATDETWQVTNVLTGAFRPEVSPDGTRLAYVTYSSIGYDVAVLPFEPDGWRRARPYAGERPKPTAWEGRALYPVGRYDPLETLGPRYWLPVLGSDPEGATLGAVTGGSDVVGLHAWTLSAVYGLESRAPAFDATWSTRVFYPELNLVGGSFLTYVAHAAEGTTERQSYGSLTAAFPLTRYDWRITGTLGYEVRSYDPRPPSAPAVVEDEPVVQPRPGLAAATTAGLSFSNVQRFPNSVSPARGGSFSLALRGASRYVGSEFEYGSLEGSTTRYLPMPWHDHHVLALRIGAGLSRGDIGKRRVFTLGGGLGLRDPILDIFYMRGSYGAGLRGYPIGAFAGSKYVLGNAEYRFPIATVDTGAWTLPFFVRRVHGALTADAGEAQSQLAFGDLHPSVGAELRAEVLLGYNLQTLARLGYARGLGPDGINDVFFTLGGAF